MENSGWRQNSGLFSWLPNLIWFQIQKITQTLHFPPSVLSKYLISPCCEDNEFINKYGHLKFCSHNVICYREMSVCWAPQHKHRTSTSRYTFVFLYISWRSNNDGVVTWELELVRIVSCWISMSAFLSLFCSSDVLLCFDKILFLKCSNIFVLVNRIEIWSKRIHSKKIYHFNDECFLKCFCPFQQFTNLIGGVISYGDIC